MTRIAYIGTYVPQKCGIATYTSHLRQSVRAAKGWNGNDPVFAFRPTGGQPEFTDPSISVLDKDDRHAYGKLAERINRSDVSVVSLQHEFGIFGGEAGDYVLEFAGRLEKPLAVTFHTVFETPEEPYARVQRQLADLSTMILVMSRKAADYLHHSFGTPRHKIHYVPHGTPEPEPGKRSAYRRRMGWSDRKVIMSFGLLSRGKGLETVISALPEVVRNVPNALYVIVGQTHPEVRKREGETYREELRQLIRNLGVEEHVSMLDRYVDEDELVGLLSACDLYVTPYPGMQQITSGTLAYALGLGKPVLSTPYVYAEDLLGDHPDLLLPPGDAGRWAEGLTSLLSDDRRMKQLSHEITRIGSQMHWPKVGKLHLALFEQCAAKVAFSNAN